MYLFCQHTVVVPALTPLWSPPKQQQQQQPQRRPLTAPQAKMPTPSVPTTVPASRKIFLQSIVWSFPTSVALIAGLPTEPSWATDEKDMRQPQQTLPAQVVKDNSPNSDDNTRPMFKTSSGLKYIDLVPGTGPTPQYGQLVSIAYTSYIKLPPSQENANPQPQQFDHQSSYLLKHGNGRMIPGLDEGLHTLQVGGTRRLLIPPKLGYIESGLGPMPPYPWQRNRLNQLLDDMIRLRGGTLIVEVTLLAVGDDDADQGYYQDDSLSPEDFETLKNNIQRKAAAAAAMEQQSATNVV